MRLSVKSWTLVFSYAVLLVLGAFLFFSNGAAYRYSFPSEPPAWELPCEGDSRPGEPTVPLKTCAGGPTSARQKIFLLGDSHAVQLVFPLREVAEQKGMALYYPETDPLNYSTYPYTFWEGPVASDEVLDFVLRNSSDGDVILTSIHRGRFNPSRDTHISTGVKLGTQSKAAKTFELNMARYLPQLGQAGLTVYLVNDSPLLPDTMTSISECMYQFTENLTSTCDISLEQDLHTRAQLDTVFNNLAEAYSFVHTVDVAPELFRQGSFTPINDHGEYRMIDKHHLSAAGAMELLDLFERTLSPTAQ